MSRGPAIFTLPYPMFSLLLSLIYVGFVLAQPATLQFQDCFAGNNTLKLNVSTVYGQLLSNNQAGTYLNLTVFGQSAQGIIGSSNQSTNLATLFTTTSILTLNAFTNSSYLCSTLRPPSPLPSPANSSGMFCPIAAGPFGLSSSIPWGSDRQLTTLDTRLRAVDPFSNELLCIDVPTTALQPGRLNSPYGNAVIIFWFTLGLAIAYWLVVGIARIVSALGRGVSRPRTGLGARLESAGFILTSAISGERLATSPALMRFCTPSMRDIIFHTQWCATLAMVAVQWPTFVYPLLSQAAWSTLSYNITLTNTKGAIFRHWSPLSVQPFNPPSGFADQVTDPTSPLYINTSVSNVLFTLPTNVTSGISSFAYTVGLRPQDLFSVCLTLFLAIIAGTIIISLVLWSLDWLLSSLGGALGPGPQHARLSGSRSPRFSSAGGDVLDSSGINAIADEIKSVNGHPFRFNLSATFLKSLWRRTNINSFHGSVLHGNLVRILMLFHLPVTIFSCYQMTLPRSQASSASIALAALSFIVFSFLLPFFLVSRVTLTTTSKLYDETRTLLNLGPLYNHYRHGSQLFVSLFFVTNFAFGVTVGCGQKSGTVQAIIILVIEVASALVTSVWLPWGWGASMGLISFLFCVARIVIAVLLVILTPTISIGAGPGGWIAYGILIILALVYCAFALILVVKLIEAVVRIFSGVGFDRSNRVVDTGLLGTCGLLGFCGPRPRRRARRRYRPTEAPHPDSHYLSQPVPGMGKASIHSGPPPSVLRPEHALRPYREESDDENAHIMGAWQPFPRPAYQSVNESPTLIQSPTSPNTTGFSRVGGGRAHYESPYAIAMESPQMFPSVERSSFAPPPPAAFGEDDALSISRQQVTIFPSGAMQPVHVRTKSQTAVIENTPIPLTDLSRSREASASAEARPNSVISPPIVVTPSDDDSDTDQPKKKPWYHLRRPRPRSEGSAPRVTDGGGIPSPSEPGRSFVVIRGHKPLSPTATSYRPSTPSPLSQDPESTTAPDRPGSFLVLRGQEPGSPRGFHAST